MADDFKALVALTKQTNAKLELLHKQGEEDDSPRERILDALPEILTAKDISKKETDQKDIEKYKDFEDIADILLFDSKGYERSESFNHELLNNVNISKPIMVAGDIKTNDLVKFKDTPYLVDISGHLESKKGVKDLNKIDKFLNTVHNINL